MPDSTTLLKFRRLLEKHQLGGRLFASVGQVLQARGLKVGTGTIVGATIIGAPSSTKNADKPRDFTNQRVRKDDESREVERSKSRNKPKMRARVEHVRGGQAAVGIQQGALPRLGDCQMRAPATHKMHPLKLLLVQRSLN